MGFHQSRLQEPLVGSAVRRIGTDLVYARFISLCLIILSACTTAGAASYTITDLGTLGGDWSSAMTLNNSGQVAGISHISGSISHAFVWQNGTRTDICTDSLFNNAFAWDINDFGTVVGHGWTNLSGFVRESGVTYRTGGVLRAVNDAGQVAGAWYLGLWQDGRMQSGIDPGGCAWAINNLGDVAGNVPEYSFPAGGPRQAWVRLNGLAQPIGTLGGDNACAYGINDVGQVVGDADRADGTYHAFLWQSGQTQDLGTLGGPTSSANAISSTGRVVGESDGPDGLSRAFIWESGVMADLNQRIDPGSGWVLGGAYDINDYGQIVGWGYRDGYYRAFMLTPVYTTAIKNAPDGSQVEFGDMVVTAVFGYSVYVEAKDRSFGIRVDLDHHYAPNFLVAVSGTIGTDANSERFIDGSVSGDGEFKILAPVGLSNRAIGGGDWKYNPGAKAGQRGIKGASGLNNIGLLIKTWGTVTRLGTGCIYVDDGSSLRDGTQTGGEDNIGVRVATNPAWFQQGDKVKVIGISSCFKNGDDLCRLIKATSVTKL